MIIIGSKVSCMGIQGQPQAQPQIAAMTEAVVYRQFSLSPAAEQSHLRFFVRHRRENGGPGASEAAFPPGFPLSRE
jgi:hypothetical protein